MHRGKWSAIAVLTFVLVGWTTAVWSQGVCDSGYFDTGGYGSANGECVPNGGTDCPPHLGWCPQGTTCGPKGTCRGTGAKKSQTVQMCWYPRVVNGATVDCAPLRLRSSKP